MLSIQILSSGVSSRPSVGVEGMVGISSVFSSDWFDWFNECPPYFNISASSVVCFNNVVYQTNKIQI